MKRRILVFLLALCLAAALVPVTAFAGGPSFSGAGTQDDPWLITSHEDLSALANFLNSGDAASFDTGSAKIGNCYGYYFKQTADIDLADVENWEPIGYSGGEGIYFAGNYDGGGHIIAHATSSGKVDGDGYATAGIFGWVLRGSVKNLHVKNANFVATGQDNYSYVGGIAGVCFGASIENCLVTDSKLESRQDNNNNCAGSIAGYSTGGKFEKCAAEGNKIKSMAYGGGFVGEVDDDVVSKDSTFKNCYAADCIVTGFTPYKSGSSFIGGFAGQITNEKPTAENCFVYRATLSIDGTSASNKSIGVFAGNLWGNPSAHYQSKIITQNCFYGKCGTTENAEGAEQKTAEEFENGTVAKLLGDAFVQHGDFPVLSIEPADYSAVDAAIAKADKLNRDEYKDFSGVEAAINAVVRGKTLREQAAVDAMAKAIEDAIAALQYKGADYSKVDAAIAKAKALNKDEYKDFSAVDAAVNAVVRGKTLREQAAVDAMAKAIEDAIAALEKKPVETTVQLPQTGDDSNLALWAALLLVSGAAICTMMAGKKRNYGK